MTQPPVTVLHLSSMVPPAGKPSAATRTFAPTIAFSYFNSNVWMEAASDFGAAFKFAIRAEGKVRGKEIQKTKARDATIAGRSELRAENFHVIERSLPRTVAHPSPSIPRSGHTYRWPSPNNERCRSVHPAARPT